MIKGLHHITLLAQDALTSVEFYRDLLGLCLVKKTVNFDSPSTYHLYFGDRTGKPGSLVTVFPVGEIQNPVEQINGVSAIVFEAPAASFDFWASRFESSELIDKTEIKKDRLAIENPEGLTLYIDFKNVPPHFETCNHKDIPDDFALQGISGLEFTVHQPNSLAAFLVETMGFTSDSKTGLLTAGQEEDDCAITIQQSSPSAPHMAKTPPVHHVAWRLERDDQQLEWQHILRDREIAVTKVLDRKYFHSFYFRIPGLLFEIATDEPGFTIDEPVESLGSDLQLPPWLESRRQDLLLALPSLETYDMVY